MLAKKLLTTAGAEDKTYVDDIFSVYLRTGTGADTTVNTNIDMTKGYMLWTKGRSTTSDHAIYDSARGVTLDLASNTTAAQTTQSTGLKSVSATGHTIGSLAKMNTSGATYVDYVFPKTPKFFDVVTYTGDGTNDRAISHSLAQEVGMVVVKSTNNSSTGYNGWYVRHRSATGLLFLDLTKAQESGFGSNLPAISTTTFTVGGDCNENGETYVAYLFAHDPSADGIIQCGSFTTDSSGNATVNLGWEPQFVEYKLSSTTGNWFMADAMRGLPVDSNGVVLSANISSVEAGNSTPRPNATGFSVNGFNASQTYIYLAIRRPNKPPTSGSQVYNAIARTGTGVAATVTGVGFAPDLVNISIRNLNAASHTRNWFDRLRGKSSFLGTSSTSGEGMDSAMSGFDIQDGIALASDSMGYINNGSFTYINHFFRRAPGFFDVVCYTGTGVARTVPHNLGVAPELMIVKTRAGTSTNNWFVYSSTLGASSILLLNGDATPITGQTPPWNDATPTTSVFTVGTSGSTNGSTWTYVTYLFASLPGISKVGSYTGNGTSQTINCGFTTGSRFILIKRIDSTGDWYVWDTSRGIVAANDPRLSLNTTAAEVTTDDSVDPESSGFIVNQNTATNINVNGGSYIFLAIA